MSDSDKWVKQSSNQKQIDISFDIDIPIHGEATYKIPRYGSETENMNDDAFYSISLSGRYKYIGASIYKGLTGEDKFLVFCLVYYFLLK